MPGLTYEQRERLSTALDRLAPTGADPNGPATVAALKHELGRVGLDTL